MKVLSLFSGIGAFEKALNNLDIPYELIGYCEIDKYASKSYAAIHNVPETLNLWDVTKVDETKLPKDIDLITYGFPCQDISLAGKQKGLFNEDGTQTRSGLFFEALRIIEATKPKIAIAENVKNLLSKKFNAQFQVVLASLEAAGYNNYYQVLNAKNYGIPQNRERVFIVSIRKDLDTGAFEFPNAFPLEKRLKDLLEDEVDEKYYLQNTKEFFIKHSFEMEQKGNGFRFDPHVRKNAWCAKTITTRAGGRMDDNFVIDIESDQISFKFDSTNPFITVDQDSVKIREATKQGYAVAVEGDSINLEQPNSKTRRGRVGKQVAQTLTTSPQQGAVIAEPLIIQKYGDRGTSQYSVRDYAHTIPANPMSDRGQLVVEPLAYDEQNGYIRKDGCVGTIMTDGSSPKKNNRVLVWDGFNQRIRADQSCVGTLTQNCGADLKRNGQGIIEANLRIRKLTPKECFRLMGFEDADFEKAEAINSNAQLYKQAGNSIVVPVIEYIIKSLLECEVWE